MSAAPGGIERELKFAVASLEPLRHRLRELGGECVEPRAFEDNRVWDRDDGRLRAQKCVLRLRTDARGARLTFKGPPTFRSGVKERLEHEVGVADAEPLAAILEALGYRVVRRYQKYREEWRVGDSVVALDHTPLGDFVELEGPDAERWAERCGLDPDFAESASYLELWERHRARHPEAPEDMVFEPEEPGTDGEAERG